MLYNKTYTQIQAFLNGESVPEGPVYRVSVLRNVILEPMEPYLRYALLHMGLAGEVTFGDYDTVMQDASGETELPVDSADAVVVCEVLELLSPKLSREFTALSAEEVEAEVRFVADRAGQVLARLRETTDAPVLWCGFVPPVSPALGVLETQGYGGQLEAVRRLNAELLAMSGKAKNVFFVDVETVQARVGASNLLDNRWWYRGRAPFSREGLGAIAGEMSKILRAVSGRVKKVLVLDCDGVLWGGVVGEDGLDGIGLGPGHPGESFMDFQRAAKELANRGVVIALNSKNNEADVWEVFEKHPHMVLSREDVVAYRINWQDKATNMREMAQELNLGLDSFVFCDDSPFECELVRSELPEVAVIPLPKDDAADSPAKLMGCGYFDSLTYSVEDRTKSAMYRAEAKRKALQTDSTDMGQYLQSLQMRLEFGLADSFSIPRVAQMTQKTNQFNLTTRRYTEDDIREFVESPLHDVVHVSLSDRFGDMGIIGSAVIDRKQDVALLDSLMLSCRALGRSVEDALMAEVLGLALRKGAKRAVGLFIPTAKNAQVADFYSKRGFTSNVERSGQEIKAFSLDLAGKIPEMPTCFAQVVRLEEAGDD